MRLGNVNIRTGPSTSYEIITTVTSRDKITRLKKGINNGERWDKVELENGIIGYIFQNYVDEIEQLPDIEDEFVESDEEINISFSDKIIVEEREISGINYNENTVKYVKDNIITDLDIEIVNDKNQILKEDDKVGTNSKILVKRNDEILRKYSIIIYGDSNGDGKINSIDLLVLQRHILEIQKLDEIYQKACNIRKNGGKPTSVDLLLIQRHILGLQQIEQGVQLFNIEEDNVEASNTNLETLAIENVLLYPVFDNNITNYDAEVSKDVEKLNILAIPENENAKTEIIGNNNLKEGKNLIKVIITAQDGITKKEININVYKRNSKEEDNYLEKQRQNKQKLENTYETQKVVAQNTQSNRIDKQESKEKRNTLIIICIFIIFIITGIIIGIKISKTNRKALRFAVI